MVFDETVSNKTNEVFLSYDYIQNWLWTSDASKGQIAWFLGFIKKKGVISISDNPFSTFISFNLIFLKNKIIH